MSSRVRLQRTWHLCTRRCLQRIDKEQHHWQMESTSLESSCHSFYAIDMVPARYKSTVVSAGSVVQSSSYTCAPPRSRRVYFFLPDFLIPCWPVFMGPFPPAFLAISSRAFLSAIVVSPHYTHTGVSDVDHEGYRGRARQSDSGMRTGLLLCKKSLVILVELLLRRLGLLVVDRVGAGCFLC